MMSTTKDGLPAVPFLSILQIKIKGTEEAAWARIDHQGADVASQGP